MKQIVLFSTILLFSSQVFFAQDTTNQANKEPEKVVKTLKDSIAGTPSVIESVVATTAKDDKNALKEAKAKEKELKDFKKQQDKLDKQQKEFEKRQNKIASSEKAIYKSKDRILDRKKNLAKKVEQLERKKTKGKLTPNEIEEENIKISQQQIKINQLLEDLDKAEKKLNKMRN